MKALIQRVAYGMVSVESKKIGEIGKGYVVLLGVKKGDTEERARELADRVLRLQLFSERNGPMERTIMEERGDILVVPEITLYIRTKGDGRPDFSEAEKPERAKELFEMFVEELKKSGLNMQTGMFGEHMLVEIYNDGPVTILEEIES